MIEFVEWACSTYGYTIPQTLSMPAAHIALLYRCNAHSSGACKSGTFMEDDLAVEMREVMEKLNERRE